MDFTKSATDGRTLRNPNSLLRTSNPPFWRTLSIISLTPKSPTATGRNWMPSSRPVVPKVSRGSPLMTSSPTVPSRRPNIVAMRPRTRDFPVKAVMRLKARTIKPKYSAGPKARA